MDACNDITLLNVIRIFKDLINVVTIIVPVILVIFVIVEVIKTITAGNVDTKKLMNSIAKRLIAAVVIFLLPFIIDFALGLFGNLKYKDCWDKATKKEIEKMAKEKADKAKEYAEAICDWDSQVKPDEKKAYEEFRVAVKNIPSKSIRQQYDNDLANLKKECTTKKE